MYFDLMFRRMFRVFVIVFLGSCQLTCGGKALNIHIKLTHDVERVVVDVNQKLTGACKGNAIDLKTTEQPHITMYLTSFEDIDAVVASIRNISSSLLPRKCSPTALGDVRVSGCYAMWEVKYNSCLQHISDAIVNATYMYATPGQAIPEWVKKLPEPVRTQKEEMIRRYGSPNVFSQFSPHVTLGYDCGDEMSRASQYLNIFNEHSNHVTCLNDSVSTLSREHKLPNPGDSPISVGGIGLVGPYGTVLRGKDLETFDLLHLNIS